MFTDAPPRLVRRPLPFRSALRTNLTPVTESDSESVCGNRFRFGFRIQNLIEKSRTAQNPNRFAKKKGCKWHPPEGSGCTYHPVISMAPCYLRTYIWLLDQHEAMLRVIELVKAAMGYGSTR